MAITAAMVKELRELTGAGMMDCKKALNETNGNMEEAVTWLREKGISKAAKKQTRIAAEGLALAKVEYSTWFRWALKVVITIAVINILILSVFSMIL